jgi:hypothetical protein
MAREQQHEKSLVSVSDSFEIVALVETEREGGRRGDGSLRAVAASGL